VIHRNTLLALAIGAGLLTLAACSKDTPETAGSTPDAPPAAGAADASADAFVKRVNEEYKAASPELNAAQWLASTYINDDSQLLSAKASEQNLNRLNGWIKAARQFEGKPMSADSARAILLLKLATAMPPPSDPKKVSELTTIATRMEGMYGAGKSCSGEGPAKVCRDIGQLSEVLAGNRDYTAQLDAWRGWHTISQPMRKDYVRFVELVNEGAREMGFADAGEMWRSGYDMSPTALAAETDRLWGQVKPLYDDLHCYARTKLKAKYGADKGQVGGGMLPAHLMGNLWQQDWGNLWDVLQPYPDAGSLDINGALQARHAANVAKLRADKPNATPAELVEIEREAELVTAKQMTQTAEDFYVSLGMPKLPSSYWQKTQFIKPRDRDVQCHASAWDMDMAGDVRTKMCIKPNEEEFTTIYHELGHVYYYLAYNHQPPLFQNGAHDGFHEAIGDTIVLGMTPKYLQTINLAQAGEQSQEALINTQMRMALAKISFMPFGLMIDRWRWGVFDGSIKPEQYNKAWWDLKAKYQGVAPSAPRGEEFFDPGAKYHVPANTPYTRYFLSHILQFQFYKSLCDASGHTGPLYDCSFYGNKDAGKRYWTMLGKGASQPWQKTMKELTGGEKMDGTAVLEYFAPLQAWLKQQNEGQSCGWQPATKA
jgi:peptidyl-dipeptidase A